MKILRSFLLASLIVVGGGALLIVSWYGEENYRGARFWAKTRRELEAKGASFEFAHFIPAPVPDEQNFALAPFFTRLYQYRVDPKTRLLTFSFQGNINAAKTTDTLPFGLNGGPVSGGPGWAAGRSLELEKFQQYYRSREDFPHAPVEQPPAADVLLALTRFGPLLDEVDQEVASHPQARFPVNWTQKPAAAICFPHYNLIQKLVMTLRLRACSALVLGQTDAAFRNVTLGLRLRGTVAPEPTLIAGLVDVTCCGALLQPVWEGLARQRWSAAQLDELRAALSTVDLLRNYRRTLQSRCALVILPLAEDLRQTKDLNKVMAGLQNGQPPGRAWPKWMSTLNRSFPRGWYDEAKATAALLNQEYSIDPVDSDHHRIDSRKIDEGNAFVHNLPVWPSTLLSIILLPVSDSVEVKIAHMQGCIDEAIVACALERYHLDHQAYPPDLNVLVPGYLTQVPRDVIDGAAMRYEPAPDGRYRLWEVGWNGRDEGGKTVWQNDTMRPDDKQGDWVWQYDALENPAFTAREHKNLLLGEAVTDPNGVRTELTEGTEKEIELSPLAWHRTRHVYA